MFSCTGFAGAPWYVDSVGREMSKDSVLPFCVTSHQKEAKNGFSASIQTQGILALQYITLLKRYDRHKVTISSVAETLLGLAFPSTKSPFQSVNHNFQSLRSTAPNSNGHKNTSLYQTSKVHFSIGPQSRQPVLTSLLLLSSHITKSPSFYCTCVFSMRSTDNLPRACLF